MDACPANKYFDAFWSGFVVHLVWKLQIPNPKFQGITNNQAPTAPFRIWSLVIPWSLGFGIWSFPTPSPLFASPLGYSFVLSVRNTCGSGVGSYHLSATPTASCRMRRENFCQTATSVSCLLNSFTFVAIKIGRRQGGTKEHILCGSVTEKQRWRWPFFIATLWAGKPLAFSCVAQSDSPEHFRGSHFSRALKNVKISTGKCKGI